MTPELRAACKRAMHVITADGEILRAGRAAVFILERIGYPTLGRALRVPPLIWFMELGYFILARNRRFFARFLFRREYGSPAVEDE